MVDIVQRTEAVLRQQAAAVPVSEITTPKIQSVISDMKKALATQADGIAIAAPQIGQSLRIFIVSGGLLSDADPEYKGGRSDLVFINPELTKLSRTKKEVEEGCLSVRWLYGTIKRSDKATIRAYNEKGERVERGASGLLAQIFQHEVDHLEGILFTDHATELWEMTEEEVKEAQKKN